MRNFIILYNLISGDRIKMVMSRLFGVAIICVKLLCIVVEDYKSYWSNNIKVARGICQ